MKLKSQKSKIISNFFTRFRHLKPWAKILIIAGFLAFTSLTFAQTLGLIDIFSSDPKASEFRGKTILFIKPVATGEGEGRFEAGDVVEIRDGDELADLLGSRPLLSDAEAHDFLVVYYDGKIPEEIKNQLLEEDREITGEQDEDTGEPVTKLKKIRKAGIDYIQFLTAEEVLKVRQFKSLDKIPQINASHIKIKNEKEVSVVKISDRLARADKIFNSVSRGSEKILQIITPKALAAFQEVTKVVDPDAGSGYDYLSLALWNTGRQGNITAVGRDTVEIAKCRATGGTADSTVVNIDGWTTDATHYIKIWTDPSENYRHQGVWSDSKYHLSAGGAVVFKINEDYVKVDGLQFNATGNYRAVDLLISSGTVEVSNNIIKSTYASGNTGAGIRVYLAAGNFSGIAKIWNNIIYDYWGSAGNAITVGGGGTQAKSIYVYNNTAYNCDIDFDSGSAIDAGSTLLIYKNNLAQNYLSTCYSNTGKIDTKVANLSEDATSPNDEFDSKVVAFRNESGKDFHLDYSDTSALNNGTNLTSDPDGHLSFTTDIDSQTRPASDSVGHWDIGADEAQVPVNERAYIFENDDQNNVNSNTDMAAANTAVSGIKKGERLEARFQIDNTTAAATGDVNYKVQYDRKNSDGTWEGKWPDVDFGGAESGNSGADSGDWNTTTVGTDFSDYSSMAIDTEGNPVIAYFNHATSYLRYVHCVDAACSSYDSPVNIDDLGPLGGDLRYGYISIAIGIDNVPVISYYNDSNQLKFARFVGSSGGTGCSATSAWTCTTLDNGNAGPYISMAIGSNGIPYISYQNKNTRTLKMARCADALCSSANIYEVDPTTDVGYYTSIAIGTDGYPVIAYYYNYTSFYDLRVAKCYNPTCTSPTITPVDTTDNVGDYASIAIGTDGNPVISYRNKTNNYLKVAHCTTTSCSSSNKVVVDDLGAQAYSAAYSSIAISSDGNPIISYFDDNNNILKVAKCGNLDCSLSNTILDINDSSVGNNDYINTSIAIAKDGYPVIAFNDNINNIEVAKMLPIAEIQPGWGISGANGDNLTNPPGPAAGACQGGTSWQDGEWSEGSKTSPTMNLGANSCTELAFMLDTSEAVVGMTYRLRLVTSSGAELTTYTQYPTFTVVSESGQRYSKENVMRTASSCGGNSDYNCANIQTESNINSYSSIAIGTDGNPVISYAESAFDYELRVAKCNDPACSGQDETITTVDSTGNVFYYTSIAIGTDGNPVIAYYYDSPNYDLMVAKCNDPACSGQDETITTVDSTNNVGQYASIAIGTDGYPVISYYDGSSYDLKVTKCGNASCSSGNTTTIDSTGSVGQYTSIAIGTDGNPVISYYDATAYALKFVHCTNTSCSTHGTPITIDDPTNYVGAYTSLAIGTDGYPMISYQDVSAHALKVAKQVSGGTGGCGVDWTCTTVDSTSDVGYYTSIAIGTDGYPVISYYAWGAYYDLKVAKQVSGGTGGCGVDWTCTTVDSTGNVGRYTSLAIGTDGLPVISYFDTSNATLKVAKALGLPTTAAAYFGNGVGGDKQIKFKADTTSSQFLQAVSAIEDGLKYWFDNVDYINASSDDKIYSSVAASSSSSPVFNFTEKFSSLPSALYPRWYGHSDSSNTIKLEVFDFNTNQWSNPNGTAVSNSCTSDCVLKTSITNPTTLSNYLLKRYNYDSTKRKKDTTPEYWSYWRVYQDTAAGSQTLQTNTWTLGLTDTTTSGTRGDVKFRGDSFFR
jgi:hypothetical protein